ncbi:hypothetical protein [Pseudomonas sp. MWU13-2100]|uniref:hypothetical protein n=1 Tax=Pseudomonas sp. MWU13-2100 TaxID=2935075 RepID=UPI00201031A8|nr:hypothetical protein [Pseudomonas sp. MWU13-2100]
MKRTSIKVPLIASLLTLALSGGLTQAAGMSMDHGSVLVGGQSMLPSKDIVDNAVNSADHTTYDVMQSNGVIQVIDKVLPPKS